MRMETVIGCGLACALAGIASARPDYMFMGPLAIPDSTGTACAGTITGAPAEAVINVPDNFTISSVTCAFHITHSWQGDLIIALVHPNGTAVELINRAGSETTPTQCGFFSVDFGAGAGPGQMFVATDSAIQGPYDAPPLPTVPAGGGPGIDNVSGDWKPYQALSAFNGLSSLGDWKVRAIDHVAADTGAIQHVVLTLEGGQPCYPDCNQSTTLTIADFGCFQAAFGAGNMYADCNGSGTLTIADFGCFQAAFAEGCP
jgi:subtilisin-like proprotein convertase family protein